MERVPEPELMDDAAQARAYAEADFSEPHEAFVDHFSTRFPGHAPRRVLDLGCGPADISIRFLKRYPACRMTAVDGAPAMLQRARDAVVAAGVDTRIRLVEARLPAFDADQDYDTLISNSLLHHLADPAVLWRALPAAGRPGSVVFVMDLMRPGSLDEARALVDVYAAAEPEILRRDFYHSLLAAYRPDEVRAQLHAAALDGLRVEVVSDRHVLVFGALP